jgi:hypothetical protein
MNQEIQGLELNSTALWTRPVESLRNFHYYIALPWWINAIKRIFSWKIEASQDSSRPWIQDEHQELGPIRQPNTSSSAATEIPDQRHYGEQNNENDPHRRQLSRQS